jgi:glutathione S-transferase
MLSSSSSSSVKSKLRYLSAWFCPYAHRATLALEYHSSFIDYEWIEALGWEQRFDENHKTEWYYHWKADELQRANPSALVPTLIPLSNQGVPVESQAVYESLICIDYIDALSRLTAQQLGADFVGLVPIEDPYLAAKCRLWTDKVNKECCSPYYGVLVRTDEVERQEHFETLIQGLVGFSRELEKSPGPTFLSHGRISNVDLALIPWACRFYVLEHYRGDKYRISAERFPQLKAYETWTQHVFSLDFVQKTLPDKQRYLEHIKKYADSTARSKVANAVRRGVAAHELDDDKDEVTR